jgi:hypothetical protein
MSETPDVAESGRMNEDLPAANQGKTEPMPTTPGHSAPEGAPADPVPADATGSAPEQTPGDPHGVPVPSVLAAAGTSEAEAGPDDVAQPALAQPGKPDGEVST